jgi:hypothetical protein
MAPSDLVVACALPAASTVTAAAPKEATQEMVICAARRFLAVDLVSARCRGVCLS